MLFSNSSTLHEGYTIEIKSCPTPEELNLIGQFRLGVYQAQGVVIPKNELDINGGWTDQTDQAETTMQLIARANNSIVGAARISLHETIETFPDYFDFGSEMNAFHGPYGSLNRLVVSPAHRGCGIASVLTEFRLGIAHDMGIQTIVTCAIGESRRDYLKNLGLCVIEVTKDPTWDLGETKIYKMVKSLK